MLNREKEKMVKIIKKYREDENYRKIINSKNISELSEIEKIALKDMLVTDDGLEIIKEDLSNHYTDFNPIDVSTEENLKITCMNMAIAELLHKAFQNNNINKYKDFNLSDIKTRIKGDLYSTMDKPTIIKFINYYNTNFPDYLPKKAKEFMNIYHGHIKNGISTSTFIALAKTFNTNIYLNELFSYKDKNKFSRKK